MAKKKGLEMASLTNYGRAFATARTLTLAVVILCLGTSAFVCVYAIQQMNSDNNEIYAIDSYGQVYSGVAVDRNDPKLRQFEYQNHVRMAYELFYSFDQYNFEERVEKALHLFEVKVAKNLYNQYQDQRILYNLQQNDIDVRLQQVKVELDMNQSPVVGVVTGVQVFRRPNGEEAKRHVDCKFTIQDLDRPNENNPHGALIMSWEVIDDSEIK